MNVAKRIRFNSATLLSPATGVPLHANITDDDIRLFRALAFHYHYLSPEYIAPLLGRSYGAIARRTRALRRPPNNYLRFAPDQEHNKRRHYWGDRYSTQLTARASLSLPSAAITCSIARHRQTSRTRS
jgi:hypothetical protein